MTEQERTRHKRRELYKLIIARDSIEAAGDAVGLAVRLNVGHDHPLFNSLCRDVVSSYGRPFTEMKPFGSLPAKWAKFGDKGLESTHDMLMGYRHKNVAHTDYIKDRVVIFPPNAPRPGGTPSANITFEVLTQFYAPNAYPHIQKLCGDLAGRLHAEIRKLLTDIYGDGTGISKSVELITREDIEAFKEK